MEAHLHTRLGLEPLAQEAMPSCTPCGFVLKIALCWDGVAHGMWLGFATVHRAGDSEHPAASTDFAHANSATTLLSMNGNGSHRYRSK